MSLKEDSSNADHTGNTRLVSLDTVIGAAAIARKVLNVSALGADILPIAKGKFSI
jgi:hypothetical protein